MSDRILLGMLTPSSNTVLEPVTAAMVAGLEMVSIHYSRFPVTEIALSDSALSQFDDAPILAAASLLADAHVDIIAWNGTSAGWLGFETDIRLCRRITDATGIAATTSVLALKEVFKDRGIQAFGLVSPYLNAVQQRIVENFARAGFGCIAERHLDIQVNAEFSTVSDDTLRAMVREVAAANPQAITTFCTNLRAAPLVSRLEQETGIPIYDSIAVVIWKALQMVGMESSALRGWGSLFENSVK